MIKLTNIVKEIKRYDPELDFVGIVERLKNQLKTQYPELETLLVFYNRKTKDIYISNIVVGKEHRSEYMGGKLPKSKKIGLEVLKKILDFADKHNKTVALHAVARYPEFQEKLESYYAELGFKKDTSRNDRLHGKHILVRTPGTISRLEEELYDKS